MMILLMSHEIIFVGLIHTHSPYKNHLIRTDISSKLCVCVWKTPLYVTFEWVIKKMDILFLNSTHEAQFNYIFTTQNITSNNLHDKNT